MPQVVAPLFARRHATGPHELLAAVSTQLVTLDLLRWRPVAHSATFCRGGWVSDCPAAARALQHVRKARCLWLSSLRLPSPPPLPPGEREGAHAQRDPGIFTGTPTKQLGVGRPFWRNGKTPFVSSASVAGRSQ